MIKTLRKYCTAFCVVAALAITLSACTKEEMQIRGSWIELSASTTWVFNKDNSFVVSGFGDRWTGTYKIDKNSLYIEAGEIICDFVIVEINKSTMKLSGSIYNWNYDETDSGTLTFMRAK